MKLDFKAGGCITDGAWRLKPGETWATDGRSQCVSLLGVLGFEVVI